jgi:hypothetical protein
MITDARVVIKKNLINCEFADVVARSDLAVGVGLEPTSSRLTIERWTSSATLQNLVGLARIELAA